MTLPPPVPPWTPNASQLRELARAKRLLEHPGLTARLANLVGGPIEKGFKLLPANWSRVVNTSSRAALMRALAVAVGTLRPARAGRSSDKWHKLLVGASGGVGGAFGLAALAVELPVSTTIMLRSIADIARDEGHDLTLPSVRLSCLEVFALGGQSGADDGAESGYWAVRLALAKSVSEAATLLAQRGILDKSAPALLRLVAGIASRFGVVVSEQLAAKAIPVVGAAGGSVINVLFMNHFQDMARGHFIVKRYEQVYGWEAVKQVYDRLPVA